MDMENALNEVDGTDSDEKLLHLPGIQTSSVYIIGRFLAWRHELISSIYH